LGRAVSSEVAPAAVEPEAPAPVAEPEAPALEVVAKVVAKEEVPPSLPAVEALRPLVPEAPPAIIVGADGRSLRAVTVYLPAELVDRLVLYSRDKGLDVVREAIEASIGARIFASVGAAPSADFARADRAASAWSARLRDHGVAPGLLARVERWIEHGRAVVTALRLHVRTAAA
jgi:hypothetical protein